ncbi:hypothetical protein [Natrarchaeobaculum sulfurireducens]|uniref:hypothetical protein n=1 Tax=Natrarchaeobaculum sulfurireducens TaxID=2044521 RepID=UPI00225DD8DD|nr:hypothetical protein [Natrarchaeobaculum sulfurireducens]
MPKSTVQYRLSRLKEDGVVLDDRYDIDLEKFGLRITVITEYDDEYHERVIKNSPPSRASLRLTSRWATPTSSVSDISRTDGWSTGSFAITR